MACRNSGSPALGVYFVNPASSAAIAACLMCSGVSKPGSPAPKPHTSMPSAFIALALLSIERVREGDDWQARAEVSMAVGVGLTVFTLDNPHEEVVDNLS